MMVLVVVSADADGLASVVGTASLGAGALGVVAEGESCGALAGGALMSWVGDAEGEGCAVSSALAEPMLSGKMARLSTAIVAVPDRQDKEAPF